MSLDRFANFAFGTLATGMDASQTTATLQTSDGSRFPSFASSAVPYQVVIYNATDFPNPADDPNHEIMRVTNRSGDSLSAITRGQEGTASVAHNTAGKTYRVALLLTAKAMSDIDFAFSKLRATAFRATLNGSKGFSSGTPERIPYNVEAFDAASEFDVTLNRFVAAAAGKYRFHVSAYLGASTNAAVLDLTLRKNGNSSAPIAMARRTNPTGTGEITMACECLEALAAGDYVEAWFSVAGSGATIAANYPGSTFEGQAIYS